MKRKLMLAFNRLTPISGKNGQCTTPYPICLRAVFREWTDMMLFL